MILTHHYYLTNKSDIYCCILEARKFRYVKEKGKSHSWLAVGAVNVRIPHVSLGMVCEGWTGAHLLSPRHLYLPSSEESRVPIC